jgi:two-component sensor histidine kinase
MMAVASILGLQADSLQENTDPAQALRDAQARVRSLIVMYEKLYVSSYTDMVSMKDFLSSLVDEVLDNYSPAYPIELRKALVDFPIAARYLQPLSIIINELVTNALKYAFEADRPGEISITVDYSAPTVQIRIADDGKGLPEGFKFENSPGFGLQLVYALVDQLQGTATFDSLEPGAQIIIEFPIEDTPA